MEELSKTTLKIPPPGSSREDLEAFRKRWFKYENVVRNRRLEQAALNLQYYLGNQWIYLDTDLLGVSGNGYSFRSIQPKMEDVPKPVTNYCVSSVETELAANARRKLIPVVMPSSPDPSIKAAARQAQKILDYNLDKIGWPSIRNTFDLHCLLFPNAILWEYWEESFLDVVRVSNPSAKACPVCKSKFASDKISSKDMVSKEVKHQDKMTQMSDSDEMKMECCPCCDEPTPLQDSEEIGEEELLDNDYFDRPLGLQIPKGVPTIEVPTVFDYFPENSGIGVSPRDIKVHGFSCVRSLDWISEHYPEAGNVEPEDPYELARWHPTTNSWDILGNHIISDSGVYDHHCRVYTLIAEKCLQYPKGQIWIWVGEDFIKSFDLYRTVRDGEAPVHMVQVTRWKEIPGELWGKTLLDDIISPQNRINAIDSQFIEARERMGAPNLLSPGPISLEAPEWGREYGIGRIMRFDPNPMAPGAVPVPFGGTLFPIEAYQERQQCVQDIKEIAGPKGIEAGDPPKNISTTGGLQLVGEQADRRRAPREQERLGAFTKIWETILTQLSVFRTSLEKDYYEVLNEDGTWSREQYDGNTLQGQIKVKIDRQSEVDKSLYQREAVREAQADGLVKLDSQVAIKKMLELRGLPTDINQDLNYQVDRANQQWTTFRDKGTIPVIDTAVDDPRIRYQVLGTFVLSEEGQELSESARWGEIIPKISGWEEELQKLDAMDQQVRAFYQTTNMDQATEIYAKGMEIYVQQKQAYEMQSAASYMMSQGTGQPPQPEQPPPIPPPPPIFAPKYLPSRILMTWKKMMADADTAKDQQVPEGYSTPEDAQLVQDKFVQFMAVVNAYKLMIQQQQMQAQQAQQQPQPQQQTAPPVNPPAGPQQ